MILLPDEGRRRWSRASVGRKAYRSPGIQDSGRHLLPGQARRYWAAPFFGIRELGNPKHRHDPAEGCHISHVQHRELHETPHLEDHGSQDGEGNPNADGQQ